MQKLHIKEKVRAGRRVAVSCSLPVVRKLVVKSV